MDLVEPTETLEVELAATLLYSASHHSYRQIRDLVAGLPEARVTEIVELGLRHRGKHDEALRAFHAGAALRFDILMDTGGFRDMHRHRRCTQIIQPITARHGYETPTCGDLGPEVNVLAEAGILADYQSAVEQAHRASAQIAASTGSGSRSVGALPVAAGHAHSLAVQDGLRRSAIHYRIALRAGRALQLSPHRMGDVFGLPMPAPGIGQTHSRDRLHKTYRPAAAVIIGFQPIGSRCAVKWRRNGAS